MFQTVLPHQASILITNRCNYGCSYCYTDAGNVNYDELDTNQLKNIMDEMEEVGISKLHIDGGEPFERKDVFDLLRYAAQDKKFITSVATNAALLNKDNVIKIEDSVEVSVRLDGCEENHEFVRGVNTYKPTIMGLDMLLKYGKKVAVKTVINRFNQYDLEKIYKILLEKKVRRWYVSRILPFGRASKLWEQLSVTDDQWASVVNKLKEISRKYEVPKLNIDRTYDKINDKDMILNLPLELDRGIYVLPNGDVASTRSAMLAGKFVANILETNLHEILKRNSEAFSKNLGNSDFYPLNEKLEYVGLY